jgi:two-component system cell cycle sensor histidine kinase/response regulator CckA
MVTKYVEKIDTELKNPVSRLKPSKTEFDLIQERINYLHENTDFALTLFQNLIGYAIIAADFDGNIIAFNEGAKLIYGYTSEEVISRQNIELFFPKDFIEAGELQKGIAALIKDGRFSYEGEMLRKKGDRFPAQVLLTLTKDRNGKVVGFIVIVEDLTERRIAEQAKTLRESEERYRNLVEASPDVIVLMDLNYKILVCSHQAVIIFGYESVGEVIGRNIFEFLDPKDHQRVIGDMQKVLRTGTLRDIEYSFLRKNGTRFPGEISVSLILDAEGKPRAFIEILRDITERKREEDREQLGHEVLNLLNHWESTTNTIREILLLFEEKMGFEAVGIRLREGDDFPYFETNGFSEDFVQAERHLCAYDKEGKIVRDGKGNPVLECMCGNILCGRTDAELPFFTAGGSFWTNSTTDLLASTTEKDRQLRTRNRCNGEGYESVALIPLRSGDEIIGLLQLNDRRRNQFTLEIIHFFEGVGASIGIALSRKLAEDALRESEKRYRQVVENATEIIYSLDTNGNFTYSNPAGLRACGFSLEELRQYNYLDLILPEHQKRLKETYIKQFYERQPTTYVEFPFFSKSGKVVWFGQNASLVTEEGKVVGFHVIARDITERKQVEEALQKSEERFRQLFDDAPVGYFEYDAQGRITNVNRTELEMLGYSAEEIIGQPVWKFIVEKEEARQQILAKLAGTIPPARGFERTYRRKDGTTFPAIVEDRLILDLEGKIKSIRATIQDITERKRTEEALQASEKRFRELFDKAPVGYHEIDKEGKITRVNRTELDMLGYTAEEMLGRYVYEFITEEISPQAVKRKLAGTLPIGATFERTYLRKDGTTIPAQLEETLIKDSEGRIIGIRTTIQNITERKRAVEEKATFQEQLRQSQKIEAIGRLAGGIAHDFNNLLTVIKGYSQLSLTEMKEEDPLRENIEEIKKSAERAADLTHQLLAFSRRQIMEMKVLDLNDLLRNLDKMLRRVIGEDIELANLLAEDLGRVKVDPGQIEQIIMNLAVNARDAMPKGGKLTIETANVVLDKEYARTHVAVTPGRYVMLSVSDTGIGMSPEVQEKIFEPFFTTKERSEGTGLGLSMVYGIVKQSGGNIWVYSEPGKGAIFKIYFPRVEEPLEEIKEKVVKEEVNRGDETILVVEDDAGVRKMAVQILNMQGYMILEAPNGEEALKICGEGKEPIHLMVTDVVMPGMDGRSLSDRLKSIYPGMKTLYMSGYTDNAIVRYGILEKGVNYIQKPFSMEDLARKVRQVLDK